MPECKKIRRKKRQVCVGDLDTLVSLSSRAIQAPNDSEADYTEEFTPKADVWALLQTVSGESIFDSVGQEVDVTDHVYIRYIAGVTQEDWIDIDDQRLDILDVEDLDRRKEFQLLRCTNRGLNTKEATHA